MDKQQLQKVVIPKNVIIESNNQVSKRAEVSHNDNVSKEENFKQRPNNGSWNTVLSNTLELDVGDEVQVLSASINQIGSGQDNIEFLGNISDSDFLDNKARINMSYYITNELKFNIPLPLNTTEFRHNNNLFHSIYERDYLRIDLSSLTNFIKAYPSEDLENKEFIGGKLYKPSKKRLYLGKRDWCGIYLDGYTLNTQPGFSDITLSENYNVHTNPIDINIPIGLESADNISELFTQSFHRPLVIDSSNTDKYINPVSIVQTDTLDRDNFVVRDRNLFQENSYFAVSNTTSRALYLEKDRGLKNDIFYDDSVTYNELVANKIFFENMLSGDPDRAVAVEEYQRLRSKTTSFPDIQHFGTPPASPAFYSGFNDAMTSNTGSYNSGTIGNAGSNLVCGDRLNVNADRSFIKYNYNLEIELQTLNVSEGDIIMTNLLNTEENIEILAKILHTIEYPVKDTSYPSGIVDFNNQLFKNTLVSDLSFGMIDETLTNYNHAFNDNLECYGRMVPHTRSREEDANTFPYHTLPNSYLNNKPRESIRDDYTIVYDNRYLISDDYLLQESFSNLNNIKTGENKDWGYNVGVHSRYDSNRVGNLPVNSLFELNQINHDLFKQNDVGLVSGNRKELLPNLSNDKQCSYVVSINNAVATSSINGRPFQVLPLLFNNVIAGNYVYIAINSSSGVVNQFTIDLSDTTDQNGTYTTIGLDSYLLNDNGLRNTAKNYIPQTFYCDPKLIGHFVRINFVDPSGIALYLRFRIVTGNATVFAENHGALSVFKYTEANRIFYLDEGINVSNESNLYFNLLPWKKYKFKLGSNSYTGQFVNGLFDSSGTQFPDIDTNLSDGNRSIFLRLSGFSDEAHRTVYLHMNLGGTITRLVINQPLLNGNIYGYEQYSLKDKNFLGFVVKKEFPIDTPKIALFENFGISNSFSDNEFAFPISIQKQEVDIAPNGTTFYDLNNITTSYETALMIGSNKLALDYDQASSRFNFNYLHQPKTQGQGIFYNFNDCIEQTTSLPPLNDNPSREIQTIYQEENVFFEDSHDDRNILFGLGVQAPKGSSWQTGPAENVQRDFNIFYEADDLGRFITFDINNDLVSSITYDNKTPVSIEQFDLYPAFPNGIVSDNGNHNYGYPVSNTDSNRFPFILLIGAGNVNTETLVEYTAQTPITIPPVVDSTDVLIPHPINTTIAENIHAVQRIATQTSKAYRYWSFTLKLKPDKTNYYTGSSLNIHTNQTFSISKIIAYKKIPTNEGKYIASQDIISTQCGGAISSIEVPDKNMDYHQIVNTNTPLYESTLLEKLGFNLLSILPLYGKVQNFFETVAQSSNSYEDTPGYIQEEFLVKPFTTNARIDGVVIQALVRNAYIAPVYNIGIPSYGRPATTDAVGDILTASEIAERFSYPYLTIHSNITNTHNDYLGGSQVSPVNCFAIVNRSYSSGNYVFLQGSDISYIVEKKTTINNFDVSILLPNGQPLQLSNNSSVIFRISKKKEILI